jgi:hypothetical protein
MIYSDIRKRDRLVFHTSLNFIIVVLIAFSAILGNALAQSEEVRVFITGPDSLPTNTSMEYTIKIIGGPAEHLDENETGNWSYIAKITNFDPKGGMITPQEGNSTENIFKINVTASQEAMLLTLQVNGTSSNETNTLTSVDVFKEIDIFRPITVNITTLVRNPTEIDVMEARISFYVDGSKLGNITENIDANSTKEVYWDWIASKDDKGEHIVEVRINEEGSLLEFESGDNVIRKTIYIGERPEREMAPIMIFNSGFLFVIEVIAIIFAIASIMMWRNTKRGRGYYGSGSTYAMIFIGILIIFMSIPIFSVSQILAENPDVTGDPTGRFIDAILVFILGFIIVFFTWDRFRKKRK